MDCYHECKAVFLDKLGGLISAQKFSLGFRSGLFVAVHGRHGMASIHGQWQLYAGSIVVLEEVIVPIA